MNNVREVRKAKGLTMKELGALCDVSESTISNIEKGKRKPSFEVMLKLGEALNSTVGELFFDVDEYLSGEPESELDKKFNALDEHGKAAVLAVLDLEYERCVQPVPIPKVIPLFPAAAGPGEPVPENAFEEYKVNADSKADFAVRISGDSMEPEFHDGQIVLCEKRIPKDGEIAVMMVDGFLVVKQYLAVYGNIYLRSLNRERKNLDIDILESGNETVQGWGTVIHKRIPLVEQ